SRALQVSCRSTLPVLLHAGCAGPHSHAQRRAVSFSETGPRVVASRSQILRPILDKLPDFFALLGGEDLPQSLELLLAQGLALLRWRFKLVGEAVADAPDFVPLVRAQTQLVGKSFEPFRNCLLQRLCRLNRLSTRYRAFEDHNPVFTEVLHGFSLLRGQNV